MKIITAVFVTVLVLINNCFGQINQNPDFSTKPIYILALSDGTEIITRDLLIRYDELDSVVAIPTTEFSKKHTEKASIVLKMILKHNVEVIGLNQILNNHNINEKQRNLPVRITPYIKLVDEKNIYISPEAIQSVKVDTTNNVVNIVLKPETAESMRSAPK